MELLSNAALKSKLPLISVDHACMGRQVYFSSLMAHQSGGDAKTLKRDEQK